MSRFMTWVLVAVAALGSMSAAAPRKNAAPVATISSPGDGATYTAGTVVSLVGGARDSDDSDKALVYQWDVDAVREAGARTRILSFKGKTATFVPQPEAPGMKYEIRLVVSDDELARDTATVTLVPAAAAPATAPVPESSYPLGPGDEVHVIIYAGGEKQEDFTAIVSPGGTLTCPLMGPIPVGGVTPFEVSNRMRAILARDYFVDPQVLVNIKEQARKIYISGEVRNPGAYDVREGLTVMSACTVAGGFTDYAALNRVRVMRTEHNGQAKTISIDLSKVRKGRSPDLAVMAGDRIDVPHRRY